MAWLLVAVTGWSAAAFVIVMGCWLVAMLTDCNTVVMYHIR
jgi:hypothetical protein